MSFIEFRMKIGWLISWPPSCQCQGNGLEHQNVTHARTSDVSLRNYLLEVPH